MDERGQRLIAKGMAITLAFLYLFLLVSCIWKYMSTKDISSSTWEIVFIVMIPVSIGWFARKNESLTIPKLITGEPIPTDLDDKSKKKRKKYYLIDSIGLAAAFLALTIIGTFLIENDWEHLLLFPQLSEIMNIIVVLSMEFVMSVIVFYAISFVWEELTIKRYNRKLDMLEGNDEYI